jgi:signal transduction histidine kinase
MGMLDDGRDVRDVRDEIAMRDELLGLLDHELRNAVAPLLLLSDQLEAMPSTDDVLRARVGMLGRNLRSFITTLDRVAEIAQLRESALALAPQIIDLSELVESVCAELAPRAAAAGAELRPFSTTVLGRWDRRRLEQLLTHLVNNAIQYGGAGAVDIIVRREGDVAQIVVHDSGPGIPDEDRPYVFDHVDRTRSRRTGTLGIGLWVVKTLAVAMRGDVQLEGSNRGARFLVRLPCE